MNRRSFFGIFALPLIAEVAPAKAETVWTKPRGVERITIIGVGGSGSMPITIGEGGVSWPGDAKWQQ